MTSHNELAPDFVDNASIGMIGLGKLGMPIAENLIRDGYQVIGYRRHQDLLHLLMEAGGHAVTSAAEVAARCRVILLCLPDADALHSVISGQNGIADNAESGSVVVDLGTFPIDQKRQARERLAATGVELIDAPVSGTPGMAQAQRAAVMASGPSTIIERIKPILETVGPMFNVGEFGNGIKMKCIANYLVSINTAATAEALALAKLAGLEIEKTIEVIGAGAGTSKMFEIRAPWMARGEFEPANGSVAVMQKDLSVIEQLATESHAGTRLLKAACSLYDDAAQQGKGEHDIATLIDVVTRFG